MCFQIGVSTEQYNKLCALGLRDICSIETDTCRVIVVPFYSVRAAKLVNYQHIRENFCVKNFHGRKLRGYKYSLISNTHENLSHVKMLPREIGF